MRERFPVSRMPQDSASMMSNATFVVPCQLPLFATAVFVPPSNEMILNGKWHSCESAIQAPRSSETLAQDSISAAKVFAPYWTDFSAAISSRLWLPTKTVLPDSGLTSCGIWLNKTVEKSWFSTRLYIAPLQNLPRIFSASSPSFPAVCTDSGSTVTTSKKIRCAPTPAQRQILKRWCGASRFVFNKTVEYLKQPGTKAQWKKIKGSLLASLPHWCAEIPYQIKSLAIRDACKATTQVKILTKQGKRKNDGSLLEVHFRTRRDPVQSFYVPKSAVSVHGIYHTLLGTLRFREALPTTYGDGRVLCAYGAVSLTLPVTGPRHVAENQGRVVALDPGIRFKMSLKHKAFEYGKTVLDVCAAYTSKTVSWTGEIIANLGRRKVIQASDGQRMDRDLNGARGILLRALEDTPLIRDLLVPCIINAC